MRVEILAWIFVTLLASATLSLAPAGLYARRTGQSSLVAAMWARTERVYRSGICDWNADAPVPDPWVYDSRTEIRQEPGIGPCYFRCHSYMQHLPTGACMKTRTLVLPGYAGSSNASSAKHSESLDPDRRHADAPGYTTLPFVVLAVVRRYGDTWWADIP